MAYLERRCFLSQICLLNDRELLINIFRAAGVSTAGVFSLLSTSTQYLNWFASDPTRLLVGGFSGKFHEVLSNTLVVCAVVRRTRQPFCGSFSHAPVCSYEWTGRWCTKRCTSAHSALLALCGTQPAPWRRLHFCGSEPRVPPNESDFLWWSRIGTHNVLSQPATFSSLNLGTPSCNFLGLLCALLVGVYLETHAGMVSIAHLDHNTSKKRGLRPGVFGTNVWRVP